MSKTPKQKLIHIEFLRILAIFFVMFNHTGAKGFMLFANTDIAWKQWLYLFFSILCKISVPIFFMISGGLLLGKAERLQDIYRKRVLKYTLVLIGSSIIYWLYKRYYVGLNIDFASFLKILYSGEMSVALWYLYSYISLMMMLPFLRKLASCMKQADYLYLAGLSFVFVGILPICEYLLFHGTAALNPHLQGALFTSTNIVYFFMGYYFEHVMSQEYNQWKFIALGSFISLVCIFICEAMTFYRGNLLNGISEQTGQMFHSSLIAIPAYTVYLAMKRLFSQRQPSNIFQTIVLWIGSNVFGIYLIEEILRDLLLPLFDKMTVYMPVLLSCILYLVFCILLGSVIVSLLKKVPVLKSFL